VTWDAVRIDCASNSSVSQDMPERPYVLEEATWKTVDPTPYDVALLPWGATEAHNYHLPYGTDSIQSELLTIEAARRAWDAGARVVVLPTIPFGVQTGQREIKLCLNMNPSTQTIVLEELLVSIEKSRIAKLVIVNGHGGNDFRQIVREVQARTPVFLSVVNWYKIVDPAKYFTDLGDHAGELETSVMQHLVPDLVRPLGEAGSGKARSFRVRALREGWAWAPRDWPQVTSDTGVGDPRQATPAKGAAYVEAVTAKMADFLVELAKADLAKLYE
jgi:creatinine amidohydrolase